MTDYDSLEAELSALRPRQPSAELKQRIASSLAAASPVPAQRKSQNSWTTAMFVGSLIATGLLALIFWRSKERTIQPEALAISVPSPFASALDESLPSLWSYRSAWNQSDEELDSVLDKHLRRIVEQNPKRARVYVFARFNSRIDSLLGDL